MCGRLVWVNPHPLWNALMHTQSVENFLPRVCVCVIWDTHPPKIFKTFPLEKNETLNTGVQPNPPNMALDPPTHPPPPVG